MTGVEQAAVAKLFANDTIPADAGSSCAMPGSAPVHGEGRRLLKSGDAEDSWMWSLSQAAVENGSVPLCFCKNSKGAPNGTLIGGVVGYCTPPLSVPEQINLQYAAADIVVAAFVTYETEQPSEPPIAMFGEEAQGATKKLTGISHWYVNGDRKYNLNFVKFDGLKPGTRYSYKVKSGASTGAWSDTFTFRSLRAGPETRIGM